MEVRDRVLTICDLDALMEAALFNPNHLHLGREGAHLNANEGVKESLPALGWPCLGNGNT